MKKTEQKNFYNSNGNIPVISVSGETLPQAWEKAVLAIWEHGINIKTEYDKKEDPPSKDATGIITVIDPFAQPRIHKNLPGGLEDLEIYKQEVILGIHDHWINPENGKWSYTYHQRLENYKEEINQINYIIEKLSQKPFTRRAQAITWMPWCDSQSDDPPCLQRIWCRVTKNNKGEPILNMNTHWRSRDLYKAWFMNAFAFTELQKIIARKLNVKVGRYVDISDSLHIYGSYFEEIKPEIAKMKTSDYHQRSWNSLKRFIQKIFHETRKKLRDNPDFMFNN